MGATGGIRLGGVTQTSWPAGGSSNWTYSSSGNIGVSTTASVGIGTTFVGGTGEAALSVMNGNVGIGTWVPGGALVVMNGNVGIGTTAPGASLPASFSSDANARALEIRATSNKDVGLFLRRNDNGVGLTITSEGSGGPYSTVFDNVYSSSAYDFRVANKNVFFIASGGNVGIGTGAPRAFLDVTGASATTKPLAFTSTGNVGIGTWLPVAALGIAGNVGIGTITGDSYLTTTPPNGGMIIEKNVGIGTYAPTGALEIEGGNVGIGTAFTTTSGLSVMNGNVGIGTWIPASALQVNNTIGYQSVYSNGNSGTSQTINWNNGNNQTTTLNGNCTFTFTAPGNISRLVLKIVHDGTTTTYTPVWPGTVKWPGGSQPIQTATASAVDFISCFYDGTNYYCTNSLDFR